MQCFQVMTHDSPRDRPYGGRPGWRAGRGGCCRLLGVRGRRVLAGALLALALLALVFSVAGIVHAADHECQGHGCPECALMAACESLLQSFGMARSPIPYTVVPGRVAAVACAVLPGRPATAASLVSLNVRLDL